MKDGDICFINQNIFRSSLPSKFVPVLICNKSFGKDNQGNDLTRVKLQEDVTPEHFIVPFRKGQTELIRRGYVFTKEEVEQKRLENKGW